MLCLYVYVFYCSDPVRCLVRLLREGLHVEAVQLDAAGDRGRRQERLRRVEPDVHPVSITRFPLRRFSPGAGLLRNPLFHR